MKTLTVLAALILTSAQADEIPEVTSLMDWPDSGWELTMVTPSQMLDTANYYISRQSCVSDGIDRLRRAQRRLRDNPEFPVELRYVGFVCEYEDNS